MTYKYIGDMNLVNGGIFIEIPNSFDQDYAEVVKITDLNSAIGYYDATLIESGSIYMGGDWFERAASCIGAKLLDDESIDDNGTILAPDTLAHWLCQALAIDAYMGIESARTETVAFDADTPESFNGWKLDERLIDSDLEKYVEEIYGYTITDAE
jgi:hypothetical protein